jgi:hypothetical protein
MPTKEAPMEIAVLVFGIVVAALVVAVDAHARRVRARRLAAMADRVAAGAALLDSFGTWASAVDLATLDMARYNADVLTQVFGDAEPLYAPLWPYLGSGDRQHLAEAFGFDLHPDDEDYGTLTRLWRDEIRQRLAATSESPQ